MPATKLNRVVCHKDWTGSPSHAGLQTFRGTSISSTASHSVVLRSAGGEESQRPSVPLVAVGHISEKKNITGVDGLKIKYLQCIPHQIDPDTHCSPISRFYFLCSTCDIRDRNGSRSPLLDFRRGLPYGLEAHCPA